MRVDAFQYELPPELIAQEPSEHRELARLLHLPPDDARDSQPEHRRVSDLPDLLPAGALVVINDTRVIPARLIARKQGTGGRIEFLLVRRVGTCELEVAPGSIKPAESWHALGKGNKPLKFATDLDVSPRGEEPSPDVLSSADPPTPTTPLLKIRLIRRTDEDGLLEIALWTPSGEPVEAALRACGHVPLPPYIRRADVAVDSDRYQTVYARRDGAIAAPTAGLHLTHAALGRLVVRACEIASVTLHVGLGTFQPVSTEDFDSHPMHAERFHVSPSTAQAIASARERGAPVIAVGTTTVRALESAADPERVGHVLATSSETRLLVQPGHRFRVVDGLLTNFHVPRSTLMALVCAFGGTDRVMDAYRLAVAERYRFFSYGDAMLLWRRR
jgi:S-adenosylmethionine:tRNA ribosyltransferase-isomerase